MGWCSTLGPDLGRVSEVGLLSSGVSTAGVLGLGTAHVCFGAGWHGVLGITWLLLMYLLFITLLKWGPTELRLQSLVTCP